MASATTESPTETGTLREAPGDPALLSDDQLLDQFLASDPSAASAAFSALVARHGPMVLGVCRHVLGVVQDAEDAFQATFLVLSRNAGSIRDRRVLTRWLYEVAYRVALRARSRASRRRQQEKEAVEMSAVAAWSENDPALCELRPVLHEEINRLPQTYRSAVVLCYLEGRTNEEAAALLRWPVGTVKGRLARAREMLRSRLTRRGLALSATLLATWLSEGRGLAEAVSPALAERTTQTAFAAAADVAPEVLALARDIELPAAAAAPFPGWLRVAVITGSITLLTVASYSAKAPAQDLVGGFLRSVSFYGSLKTPHVCGDPPAPEAPIPQPGP